MTQKLILMGLIATATIGAGISYSTAGSGKAVNYSAPLVAEADWNGPSLHRGFTYTQAQARYAKVLKFDSCQNIAGLSGKKEFTIKKSYPFMLDNQGAEGHTFTIGSQRYEVPAHDFAIVAVTRPGSVDLLCDGNVVGKITILSK